LPLPSDPQKNKKPLQTSGGNFFFNFNTPLGLFLFLEHLPLAFERLEQRFPFCLCVLFILRLVTGKV